MSDDIENIDHVRIVDLMILWSIFVICTIYCFRDAALVSSAKGGMYEEKYLYFEMFYFASFLGDVIAVRLP